MQQSLIFGQVRLLVGIDTASTMMSQTLKHQRGGADGKPRKTCSLEICRISNSGCKLDRVNFKLQGVIQTRGILPQSCGLKMIFSFAGVGYLIVICLRGPRLAAHDFFSTTATCLGKYRGQVGRWDMKSGGGP